jgi:hypothetical protein
MVVNYIYKRSGGGSDIMILLCLFYIFLKAIAIMKKREYSFIVIDYWIVAVRRKDERGDGQKKESDHIRHC